MYLQNNKNLVKYKNYDKLYLVCSFSWLGCRPVTAEIVGSSPIHTANVFSVFSK